MKVLLTSLQGYFKQYKYLIIFGFVFVIISNIFLIYPAQVIRNAFDLVGKLIHYYELANGSAVAEYILALAISTSLVFFGLVVFVLAIMRGMFLFLVRQTLIVMSRKIEYEQKKQLFNHYQTYSLTILKQRQTGDLMARISEDVGNVRMFTGPGIMYTFNTFTLFIMTLVTMVYVNVELTFYTLLPLPFLSLSIYLVHTVIIKRSEATQRQISALTSYVQEAFSGIRLVKAFVREENTAQQYEKESAETQTKALDLVKVDALFYPLIMVLIGLSTLFTIWIGGEKIIAGSLTYGNIAEFVMYINQLIWPVASLGWVTSLTQKAAASQVRINEMLALKSELQFPAQSAPPTHLELQFKQVSYTYPDTHITALQALNFTIQEGSFVGITGPTGSGKSTLSLLIPRLMDPTEGQILLGGQPLSTYSQEALRNAVSVVPQDTFLFSDTIAANIAFGKLDATAAEVEDAARFAGVLDDILHFPEGFETVVGERGVTLSGGQKQRIAIARAYLRKAPILIMDDSLSAVDTRTEETILHNLRQSRESYRPTLILITHRVSVIEQADQILVLEDGRLIEQGKHADLITNNGLYASFHRRQQLEAEIV